MADTIKYIIDAEEGLEYESPPIPTDVRDILYYDYPKEHQYWRSTYGDSDPLFIPKDSEIKKWNEKDRIEFINMWRMRWANGLFFMNNGELVYINGMHVDHLVFNKWKGRFHSYIRMQRDDFFFREIVINNDDWEGMQWLKPRRYGMTEEEITTAIYVLLSGYYNKIGVQSFSEKKAHETIMTKLIDVYVNRPFWMREQFYKSNGKRPVKDLKLTNVVAKEDEDGWLGGKVEVFATDEKALDGDEFMYVIMDEFSKWPTGVNPDEALKTSKKCVRNYGRIGKVSCLSTTGDNDNIVDSVREWIKLSGNSILRGRRKTNSGLVQRFVPATWSLFLDEEFYPDKYGEIDEERNTQEVLRMHNLFPVGSKDYYFEQRRMPLEKAHCLTSAADTTYFDRIRMAVALSRLQGLLPDEKPYVRGRLEEKLVGSVKKVYFEHDPEGNWLIRWMPYASESRGWDLRNRFRISDTGVYFPPRNPEGVIGYDPIRYKKELVKTGHLSRAAISVHKKFDYHHKKNDKEYLEDRRIALWVGRPDRPDEAHYEAIKACKFFGYPIAIERQVESAIESFENENMTPFLLKDPKDGIKGVWTTERVKENGLKLLVSRFAPPRTEDEIDHIEDYPFEDGLIDHMDFDLANSGKFDITMSEIMLEMGLQWLQKTNVQDTDDEEFSDFFNRIMPSRKPGAGAFL
jgi:hypothetical protein